MRPWGGRVLAGARAAGAVLTAASTLTRARLRRETRSILVRFVPNSLARIR